MNTRYPIIVTTVVALLAGAISSAAETLPQLDSRDPVVESFERDFHRDAPAARVVTRDDVAADVLYAYINRPLQSPENRPSQEEKQ